MRRREDERKKKRNMKVIMIIFHLIWKQNGKLITTIILHSNLREMEIYVSERRVDEKTGG